LAKVETLPMPTIAAINGLAYGGGAELTLACDMRVMEKEATLSFSETRLGLMPDLGGTVRLIELLGHGRAMDLMCTARDISAEEGLQLGLINRVAIKGGALQTALDLATKIATNGPLAIREIKSVALAMRQRQAAMDTETEAAVRCILSDDSVEGIMAFLRKRPPDFKGTA
jgi:enoyl-CoA hydratase